MFKKSRNNSNSSIMFIKNRETLEDEEIEEELVLVRGNTIRARNLARNITQALRNLVVG